LLSSTALISLFSDLSAFAIGYLHALYRTIVLL
jgi:hypothetical protein